jgi:hypothetical protein
VSITEDACSEGLPVLIVPRLADMKERVYQRTRDNRRISTSGNDE